MAKKILYYLNQFFGQIGGEDQAHIGPEFKKEAVGPAAAFENMLDGEGEIVGTLICGDNFYNENVEVVEQEMQRLYDELKPDLVVAGPAFNAGRYGMACAGVAKFFDALDVPVVSGMYEENPGLDTARGSQWKINFTINSI
jgi:betaine reductase